MSRPAALLLSASLALLYLALRSRVAAVDALAFQRLRSWEPQVAAALAAAVLARAAAVTDAVARVAPGGRLAGAPRMAVACGATLLATAGGRGGVGPASAAWLLAAAASAALLWSWEREEEEKKKKDDDDDDDADNEEEAQTGRRRRRRRGARNGSRGSAVVETTPAALAQELDAEAEASSREAGAGKGAGKSSSSSSSSTSGGSKSGNSGSSGSSNKSGESADPSPLVAVLFYDPRGGSRAAAVCAAFDVLSEEEEEDEGEEGEGEEEDKGEGGAGAEEGNEDKKREQQQRQRQRQQRQQRPLVLYRRLDASRWPDAAAELGVQWEGAGGEQKQQPASLPALALFREGKAVASAPGEGGRLPASVGGLRRVIS